MELLAAGPSLQLDGPAPQLTPFRTVFKRYTPFSIENIEQVIRTDTVEFSRCGDFLMGVYLYVNLTNKYAFDWRKNIKSISLMIGESVVSEMPIEYILDYYPVLLAQTFSKFSYVGDNFLPVPIPDIPVCALQYNSLKIKIDGNVSNVKCSSIFVFLDEVDRNYFKKPFDLLIHQIQKAPINTDGSVYLSHPVKCIFSGDFESNVVTINGVDIVNPSPEIPLYYTNRYISKTDITGDRNYTFVDYSNLLGIQPIGIQTARFVNGNVFMFSSLANPAVVVVYNTANIFTSSDSYIVKTLDRFVDFSSSSYDGVNSIFATGFSQPFSYRIDLTTSNFNYTVRNLTVQSPNLGTVYGTVVNSTNIHWFGSKGLYVLKKSDFENPSILPTFKDYRTELLVGDPNSSLRIFTYAELVNDTTINVYVTHTQVAGNPSILEIYNPPKVGSLRIPELTRISYGDAQTTSISSLIISGLANYSANVVIGNYNYLSPGKDTVPFARVKNGLLTFDKTKVLRYPQKYQFIAYDGNKYAYLIPGGTDRYITRFDSNPTFSFFRSFCTDTQSMYSSGFLNFSRTKISFPAGTRGNVWALNYNILRFMNGMANIMYAN